MRRYPSSAVISLALALVLAASPVLAHSPMVIPLTLPSGKVFQTELEIEPQDRAMGLMFRDSLPADRALLFVFDELDFHAIWMKNCRFPIDIVWLDETRKVVHVAEAVPPCRQDPCPTYSPLQKAAFVIEMNAHAARREKVEVGARVSFELPRR